MRKPNLLLLLSACALASCGGPSTSTTSPSQSTPSESQPTLTKEGILETLQGNIGFKGTLLIDVSNGEEVTNELAGYIGTDEYYLEEEGNDPVHYHHNDKGEALAPTMQPDNTVLLDPVIDYDIELNPVPVLYEELVVNPFADLTVDDLQAKGEQYVIDLSEDEEKQMIFGAMFTQYSDVPFKTINIAPDGNDLSLQLKSSVIFTSVGLFYAEANVEIVSKDEAFDELAPYPTLAEHAALKEAFAELKKGNYTLTYFDDDLTEDNADYSATISASDTLLLIEEKSGDKEQSSGYFQTSATEITPIKLSDDKKQIIGTGRPEKGAITSKLPDYSLAAEFYLPQGNGVYLLDPIMSAYAYLNDPAYPVDSSIEIMEPGSLRFAIVDSGYHIEYTYDYTFGALAYKGKVTMDITKVGTTAAAYGSDDYVDYVAPATWESLGAAEGLKAWVGDDLSILPFPCESMGFSTVEFQNTPEYFGIYATPFEDTKIEDATNAYVSALKSAGWTERGIDIWGTNSFQYQIGEKTAHVSIGEYLGAVTIYLYPMSANNDLANLLTNTLMIDPNSTVHMEIKDTTYLNYGADNQSVKSEKSNVYDVKWTNNSEYYKQVENGTVVKDNYYLPKDGQDVLDIYENKDGVYVDSGTDTPSSFDMSLFSWKDYTGHSGDIFTTAQENVYSIEGDSLTRMIYVIGYGEDRYDDDDFGGKAKATLSTDKKSFTVEASKVYEENARGETRVVTLKIAVSDIGSTTVALPTK